MLGLEGHVPPAVAAAVALMLALGWAFPRVVRALCEWSDTRSRRRFDRLALDRLRVAHHRHDHDPVRVHLDAAQDPGEQRVPLTRRHVLTELDP